MRCQRCGFEIEPGQTFCSGCGTEVSKAMRKEKKKLKFKSFLGVIKVSSNNHFYMTLDLFIALGIMVYLVFFADSSVTNRFAYICLDIMLIGFLLFQCFIPYKNPNASKSKKYKLTYKMCFILDILFILVLIFGEVDFVELAKRI